MTRLVQFLLPITAAISFTLVSCGAKNQARGAAGGPPAPVIVNGVPRGLYFMTRFWSFTGTLEKAVWYFAADGQVYENLVTGFSPEDLAAHKGRKGAATPAGDSLQVAWTDGTKTTSKVEQDTGSKGFMFDGGIFTPIKPIPDRSALVGAWSGGESIAVGGNRAATAQTLELRADGTFSRSGVGSVRGETSESVIQAGSTGAATGTWTPDAYSITLMEGSAPAQKKMAFLFEDSMSKVSTVRLFLGGMMFNRQ